MTREKQFERLEKDRARARRLNVFLLVVSSLALGALIVVMVGVSGREKAAAPVQIKEVPVEVIKEVPKEVVREVPKEVIKEVEVPAKLTDIEKAAMAAGDSLFNAKMVADADEALYKLDLIRVGVVLDDTVKKTVSEERVKDKFELVLRRHNIPLDDRAPYTVMLHYQGLWSDDRIRLTYVGTVNVLDDVLLVRNGDMRLVRTSMWENMSFGYVGSKEAEKTILDDAEAKAESFAKSYLKTRDKEK